LATKDIKLTGWKLHELILADSLALGKAEYQITYLENGKVIGDTDSNWHIVWKKNQKGTWQILREIFNERED
jgi:ketosteroid isomerase-like protein